jgi:protein O-GlcNAc transferase
MTLEAKFNLAVQHQHSGRYTDAERLYREVLKELPAAEVLNNLALVLEAQGAESEALATFARSVAARADYAQGHFNLGRCLLRQGRSVEAARSLTRAVELCPDYADALNALGNATMEMGEPDAAASLFERAIAANPAFADPHNNLGVALERANRRLDAIDSFRRALKIDSGFLAAAYNLAGALLLERNLDEAIELYRQVVEQAPNLTGALDNLGTALKDIGNLDAAIDSYRKALKTAPDAAIASNLLYATNFHSGFGARAIRAEHEEFHRVYCAPLTGQIHSRTNHRDPNRRLRIGYVSPDFRDHCQANFTIPLLSNHDHVAFEIFCYSSVIAPDATTLRIKEFADVWRDIAALTDEQAAALIGQDEIDILVDLTMHMDRNRLLVFARKPAPVQVTWLAYPGTTGLKTIDYRLSDAYLDPPGEHDAAYTENTIHLRDTFWCYDPLTDRPLVNDLPALSNGYLTFGCLNNFCKITDVTIGLWAKVLGHIPTSRLIVRTPRGSARLKLLTELQSRGIRGDRIEPIDSLPRLPYLNAYNRFDLCLDTFPYTGHTTTLDSLWMGVPPITMSGQTAVSRGGLSLLSNVGLQRFVAQTPEQLVGIAESISADLPGLAELRGGLRARMQSSPLMDAPRFARSIESAYRTIWRG